MGLTLAQAKALGIGHLHPAAKGNRPRRRRIVEAPLDVTGDLPPGAVLLQCEIAARPVPWKAPMVGRYGAVKDARLVAWQTRVAIVAQLAYTARTPYRGPVEVAVWATIAKGPLMDATNLMKAIEDSLEGIVIVNDRQVIRNRCERAIGSRDLVRIEVVAADRNEGEISTS